MLTPLMKASNHWPRAKANARPAPSETGVGSMHPEMSIHIDKRSMDTALSLGLASRCSISESGTPKVASKHYAQKLKKLGHENMTRQAKPERLAVGRARILVQVIL